MCRQQVPAEHGQWCYIEGVRGCLWTTVSVTTISDNTDPKISVSYDDGVLENKTLSAVLIIPIKEIRRKYNAKRRD